MGEIAKYFCNEWLEADRPILDLVKIKMLKWVCAPVRLQLNIWGSSERCAYTEYGIKDTYLYE